VSSVYLQVYHVIYRYSIPALRKGVILSRGSALAEIGPQYDSDEYADDSSTSILAEFLSSKQNIIKGSRHYMPPHIICDGGGVH